MSEVHYPLKYNSILLNEPTLFYIDNEGSPVQLALNREQVQMIVDDWNNQPDGDLEQGEAPHELKPPHNPDGSKSQ